MGPAPVTAGSEEWAGGRPMLPSEEQLLWGPRRASLWPWGLTLTGHSRNEGIISGEFSLGSCLSPEPDPPVFQLLFTQHFCPMPGPMDCAHRSCPLQRGGSLHVFPTPSAYTRHSQMCAPTEIGEHAPTGVSPLVFRSINSEELREVMLSAELTRSETFCEPLEKAGFARD